jgi:dTDP-4-dehydrorhamnose reductase
MALLITGASGLLGANLVLEALAQGETVIAVGGSHRIRAHGVQCISVDLTRPGAAAELIAETRPSAVIHTAARVDVGRCEANPEFAFRLNAQVPEEVASACRGLGARLIHISTDAVFAGDSMDRYGEDDPTVPVNQYGRAKLAGERAVLEAYPSSLVVRTSIYGWNAQPKESLGEFFVTRLSSGQRVVGFSDVWMTPILASDLAVQLLRLAHLDTAGVLHVSGHDCVSKADFGRRIAVAFGYDPELITFVSIHDHPLSAPRPLRPCLRVDRAEALLGALPTVDDGIERFRKSRDTGLLTRLHSLLESVP